MRIQGGAGLARGHSKERRTQDTAAGDGIDLGGGRGGRGA